MLKAFYLAVLQLGDKAVRRYLWLGIGAAGAIFVALWVGAGYALPHLARFEIGWLNSVVAVLGGAAVMVVSWLLFPGVASGVLALFLENVADAVEARHYPALPPAAPAPIGEQIGAAVRFVVIVVAFNLALLPLLLVPPVFPFVFYAVNGYLLGREYFELVALRRMGAEKIGALRHAHRGRLWLAGTGIAFLLTVPGLNLIVPVVATAAMVHLFEAWRSKSERLAATTRK